MGEVLLCDQADVLTLWVGGHRSMGYCCAVSMVPWPTD